MAKVLLVIALGYEPTPSPFPFVSLVNSEYRHSNEVLLPKIFKEMHKIYLYLASQKNLVICNINLCQHCTNVVHFQVSQMCQEVRKKSEDLRRLYFRVTRSGLIRSRTEAHVFTLSQKVSQLHQQVKNEAGWEQSSTKTRTGTIRTWLISDILLLYCYYCYFRYCIIMQEGNSITQAKLNCIL